MTDYPKGEDAKGDLLEVDDEVRFPCDRDNFLAEQLVPSIFVDLLYAIALDVVVLREMAIVAIDCYVHLLAEDLLFG